MAASTAFPQGITNGYAWYVVNGGMQDWSYYWRGDMQLTIELTQTKWPQYNTIAQTYRQNKPSLLSFLKTVHQGAGFSFTHSQVAGNVHIATKNGQSLGTFLFSDSEFYKVLEPGSYVFRVNPNNGMPPMTFETDVVAGRIISKGNYTKL